METKTLKYIPVPHSRENNTFLEEYYSSPDVSITIHGDVVIEAASIEFGLQEQLKPIYSYTSNVFDDVAVGNRIVVGSVTVPIKNITENIEADFESGEMPVEDEEDERPGWARNSDNSNSSLYIDSGITGSIVDGNTTIPNLVYSNEVRNVQTRLLELGYDVIVNGYIDQFTKMALVKYQELNGLIITGAIDNETMNSLFLTSGKPTVNADTSIYSGPSNTFSKIGTVKKGEPVEIISSVRDFYYIKYAKLSGYIESKYAKMLQ